MTILSIQVLQEHLYAHEGSKTNQVGRPNQRPKSEALRSISAAFLHPVSAGIFPAQLAIGSRKTNEQKVFEAQRPCNPTTRQTGKKNEKVSEKRRLDKKSTREQRKRSSSRMKVYPVGNSLRAGELKAWGSPEVIDIDEEENTMVVAKELR